MTYKQIESEIEEFEMELDECLCYHPAIKSFLKQTIEKVMDEMVGEKKTFSDEFLSYDGTLYTDGYRQKRQELIKYKEEFFK